MNIPKFTKAKPSLDSFLAILPYITIILTLLSMIYTGWFIYNDIVLVANDAVQLQTLNQDVVKTKLNTNLFEEVSSEFTKKNEAEMLDTSILRNPFEIVDETPLVDPSEIQNADNLDLPNEIVPEN